MRKTALIYHEDYLKHYAGDFHPERKERLEAAMEFLREKGVLDKVLLMEPEPAREEDLLLVHSKEHVEFIRSLSGSGGGAADADTYVQPGTYEIAKLAAGGEILAGRLVVEGKANNSFAMVRPPGHHASRDKAAGFCYFNNAAVMIRYLQKQGIGKVFLIDWDAHAGNGTMDIFYKDPSILNVSVHQNPEFFYPGTGFMEQIGEGEGKGYTVNIPVPEGTGSADYIRILEEFVLPMMESFNPELVVISAGQDSHRDDAISGIRLTENCYGEMTKLLLEKADKLCDGKLVVELEGGYNLEALSRSIYNIILALLGIEPEFEIEGEVKKPTLEILKSLKETFGEYHPAML